MNKRFNTRTKATSFFVLGFFMTLLLLIIVSGLNGLTLTKTSTLPASFNPGSNTNINFDVSYTGSEDSINLTWSKSIPEDVASLTLPTLVSILEDQTLSTSVSLQIKEHATPGTHSGTLNVQGSDGLQGSGGLFASESFEFTVASRPQLSVSSKTISLDEDEVKIIVKNEGNTQLTNINLVASGNFDVALSPQVISFLNPGSSQEILVSLEDNIISLLNMGPNIVTISAEASDGTSATGTITLVRSFCRDGPKNDTLLELDVTVRNRGEGKVNEWMPLDRIEVEVRIRNDFDIELRDVMFEIGLFEEGTTRNVIADMIWVSFDEEVHELGDVREGRTSTRYTFEFRVDPDEVRLGRNYVLVVKAYPDRKEGEICIDYSSGLSDDDLGSSLFFGEVEIRLESSRDKMVIIDDHKFVEQPIKARCGQDTSFFVDVYNIGNRDFEERIKVTLFNSELGIEVEDIIHTDLYSGDRTISSFYFKVPINAQEKTYPLYMKTYYDYRERDGTYRESSSKTFTAYLDVEGGCLLSSNIEVFPSLVSEAIAGRELTIKVILQNKADTGRLFNLDAHGYERWGESLGFPEAIFIESGNSGEILIKFKVNRDVSGEQNFNINVYSEGKLISTEQVSFNVQGRKGIFEILGITGFAISGENVYLWGLGLLNILLVVIIILIAVKIAKRKDKEKEE